MSDTSTATSPTRTSLTSWWKQFKQKHGPLDPSESLDIPRRPILPHLSRSSGDIGGSKSHLSNPNISPTSESRIFGVDLEKSVQYANVSISLSDPVTHEKFIYAYIPVVVAKCGVYLKKNATGVEGIFRLSGSARRIKELQQIFDSPPRYGKGLDWTGFNVHDGANVLRRYLNNLPESIIPVRYYEKFRNPLRNHFRIIELLAADLSSASASPIGVPSIVIGDEASNEENLPRIASSNVSEGSETVASSKEEELKADIQEAVNEYRQLIMELPPLNRQLLMYILDFLSVFEAKSDENLMPAANLAAIFQPSLLSHPQHDMRPEEYHLSRMAVEFLIDHSKDFLSYVEDMAIKEHAQRKEDEKNGITSTTPTTPPYVNGSTVPHKARHHKRRHSKSLSSVNGSPLNPNSQTGLKVERTRNHVKPPVTPISLPGKHERSDSRSVTPQGKCDSPVTGTPRMQRMNSGESNGSGFLTSIKRTVSFSRRPSQKGRATSVSSTSSFSERSKMLDKDRIPSTDSMTHHLAKETNIQHKTPEDESIRALQVPMSSLSIDEALATPASTTSSDHESPHFRSLDSVFAQSNNNVSTSSLGRTLSGESSTAEDSEARSGTRTRVSRWRRSLIAFNHGDDKSDELMIPPPLTEGQVSPSRSQGSTGGQSPNRHSWLKRLSPRISPSRESNREVKDRDGY